MRPVVPYLVRAAGVQSLAYVRIVVYPNTKRTVGGEQPKTGPRELTFPVAGRAELAVANRWPKPRV